MKRESGGLILPVAGMAAIVLVAWFFVSKSSSPPPEPRSPARPALPGRPAPNPSYKRAEPGAPMLFRDSAGAPVGWRTLYWDNWEYLCPVLGHHVVDPDEACRLIAAPARLGPIVVRDASVRYGKSFTSKRDPAVPLVRYDVKHPVMSLPEYVGPRFYAERMLCSLYPGKWMPSHRPVVDTKGRLIRYDPEQVRIFCGAGK